MSLPSLSTAITRVVCDDLHQQIIINGRRLRPGHQIYILARLLIAQQQAYEARHSRDQIVDYATLCQETGAPSRRSLRALVSEARVKLSPHFEIESVRGKGYYIVLDPEV
jgi:DNA-binding response OmpR family regulator